MSKKQLYVYQHPSVYVVLEHATGVVDAKVHGVYTTRKSADGKVAALKKKGAAGYLAVLKKPITGVAPRLIKQERHPFMPNWANVVVEV